MIILLRRLLVRAAQRQRYTHDDSYQPLVVPMTGSRLSTRDQQKGDTTHKSKNKNVSPERDVRLSGRMSLRQPLHLKAQLRPLLIMSEAVIIAPTLSRCIQQGVRHWTIQLLLHQVPCEVEINLHLKVLPKI